LDIVISKKQHVPEPIDDGEGFSGKLGLRLPRSLHKRAAHMAARGGVSLNQFILSAVAERLGHQMAVANMLQAAAPSVLTQVFVYATPGQSKVRLLPIGEEKIVSTGDTPEKADA
jgi:hypothetical protein